VARKLKTFEVFGIRLRGMQLGAVDAFALMAGDQEPDPMDLLPVLEVYAGERGWVHLDTREEVNAQIRGRTFLDNAHVILDAIIAQWSGMNVGGLASWKPIKVPSYLRGDAPTRSAPGLDPIIQSLVNSGKATLRELEEYYTLEDALKLFDTHMANAVNEADSRYRAAKDSKR
jgi:hypothetical protein